MASLKEFFSITKMMLGASQLVDPNIGVWDILTTLCRTLGLFLTLMNFILAKFDELETFVMPISSTMHDTFMWNWFKISICYDVLFILSCINEAVVDEIQWLTIKKKVTLVKGI